MRGLQFDWIVILSVTAALLGTSSCTYDKKVSKSKSKDEEFTPELIEQILPPEHTEYIWNQLTDASISIDPILTYIEKNEILNSDFDFYQILRQVVLQKELSLYEKSKLMESDSIDIAYKKIESELDKLFNQKIVFDCILRTPLVYRYVFLQDGTANEYTWMGGVWCSKMKWEQHSDTILLIDEDIRKYLIHDDMLNPIDSEKPRRPMYRIR